MEFEEVPADFDAPLGVEEERIDLMSMIKLTKPFMRAPAVTRLQELLDGLGSQFDTGYNDGIYGPLSELGVKRFQTFAGILVDGVVGPITWAAVLKATDDLRDDGIVDEGIIIDRRGMHKKPRLWGRFRGPGEVLGITLHQTGCEMPSKPSGWDRLNAHIGITQEGKAILVNDFESMIWHAQKLSHRTIGIEIEGNYYGAIGREWSLWEPGGGPHHLNDEMLIALEALYVYLRKWFTKHSEWKHIHAHRQSYKDRTSDPGEEIWKAVGLPWIKRSRASDGGERFYLGKGYPIPHQWNVAYNNAF